LTFADRLLDWFDQYGRKNLPWHQPRTAYHVWVSEIMLQQTQVQTVIPYYEKFIARFPDLTKLAQAQQDEVLAHWSGLGYYARGRNLHRTAQIIQIEHQGIFPSEFEKLIRLPGIGRSTAHAILAQAFNQPLAILDGNVKRVLARYSTLERPTSEKQAESQLWQLAQQLMSTSRPADYTQAIMDLGSMLCKRSKPLCSSCPVQTDCKAQVTNRVSEFPIKKPTKSKPIKHIWMLIQINSAKRIRFIQRPQSGIWGGLISLPEFDSQNGCLLNAHPYQGLIEYPTIQHSFSHYHLRIHPIYATTANEIREANDPNALWLTQTEALTKGLPAPVRTLIEQLGDHFHEQTYSMCEI